jgi:hypothetical protein
MTHPVLEEIARAKYPIRHDVFYRWQQAIRTLLATPDPVPTLKTIKPAAKPQEQTV